MVWCGVDGTVMKVCVVQVYLKLILVFSVSETWRTLNESVVNRCGVMFMWHVGMM